LTFTNDKSVNAYVLLYSSRIDILDDIEKHYNYAPDFDPDNDGFPGETSFEIAEQRVFDSMTLAKENAFPLMVTATISFATAKSFVKYSVYTHQLANRKELLTHDADHNVLTLMNINKLIERDFAIIPPDATLGDLVKKISEVHRNLFPVVDENGILRGMVKMDDVRKIIFKPELYDKVLVKDLMYMPQYYISPDDSMEDLVEMFRKSGRFNIAVIDKGKYLGFISRANAFTAYRNYLRKFSSSY